MAFIHSDQFEQSEWNEFVDQNYFENDHMNDFVKSFEETIVKKKKEKQTVGLEKFIEEDITNLENELVDPQ